MFTASDEVPHTEQRGEERVPPRLLGEHPVRASTSIMARSAVEAPGHHVAGVLDVARGVGDDEFTRGRGEVAVGDIDRDALLALGAQAVGEQREVDHTRRRGPREARSTDSS